MREISNRPLTLPAASSKDVLTEVLRAGAQRMLTQAVEAEVRLRISKRRNNGEA